MILQPSIPKVHRFQFSANFLRLLDMLEKKAINAIEYPRFDEEVLGVGLEHENVITLARAIISDFRRIEETYKEKARLEKLGYLQKLQKELNI